MPHSSSAWAWNNSLAVRISVSVPRLPSTIDLLASKDTRTHLKKMSDVNEWKFNKITKVAERNIENRIEPSGLGLEVNTNFLCCCKEAITVIIGYDKCWLSTQIPWNVLRIWEESSYVLMQRTNFGSRQLSCMFGAGGLTKLGAEREKIVLLILKYHPCSDLHISLKVYTGPV